MRLLAAALLIIGGLGWAGLNWQRLTLFHFDAARVDPASLDLPTLRDVDLDGAVLWVADPAPGKPTVFYLPGNAGNLANRAGRFRALTARGFGLVALGYPGSSGSDGPPSAPTLTRAAHAAYLAIADLTRPAPVVIYGESLGTGIAIALNASTATDRDKGAGPPAALVLEAPYTGIRALGHVHYPALGALIDRLPDPLPSLDWADQITAPLLILHGTRDRVVPIDMGRAIFAAAASPDKRMIEVPSAGHEDVWQVAPQRALFAFLARF